MKKKVLVIILLVLAIGIGGFFVFKHFDKAKCCDADTFLSINSPEQAVDVFIDNREVWLSDEKYIGTAVFCGFLEPDAKASKNHLDALDLVQFLQVFCGF